ncbi:uncharacterized protein LOC120768890 [Bactrocera tryoni]|uniref:uncharacterized protein LOC120768890 n=1 Tax=Bactrocera tryoni TaxID=59916 RepID=UPI001A970C27|nr:uncharacterized protein LOC120768890 [Bactrocera tryoni]
MSSWNNICRVCTSPAEYEFFGKIPAYLHASSNDFLHWQKPINVLLEETTGLKCAENDGLPNKICALCISYLKHAVFFREQCITNSLSLKAIDLLRQKRQKCKQNVDKDNLLITAQELNYTNEHQIDTNLLNNTCSQDQDKVFKQLLNNTVQTKAPSPQNIEQQLRYLNLLFNKDPNAGLHIYKRKNDGNKLENAEGGGEYPFVEEDSDTETSSVENEAAAIQQNIFSYSETNFQEDDIINLDELGDAITINIPESCKERKCRACFRRFMFEDSHNEHISTCIEYKFLTYIEELNKLLYMRRNKVVSPHEFVRRMIFALRKICEWLKQANCADILLPDLATNGNGAEEKSKKLLEREYKNCAVAACEQKSSNVKLSANEQLLKFFELPKQQEETTMTDLPKTSLSNTLEKTTKQTEFVNENGVGNTQKPLLRATPTPITPSNNILYKIERSQSRGSSALVNIDHETKSIIRPIAVMTAEKNITTPTTAADNRTFNSGASNAGGVDIPRDTAERLTFLQKLRRAANQTPTSSNSKPTPATPLINVRKDLTSTALGAGNEQQTASPATATATPKTIPISALHMNLSFSARCNPCNILFETLAALEVHNAMYHNHMPLKLIRSTTNTQPEDPEREAERKRIIALFENDDSDEELETGGA